jgi:hypothetical protein
MIARALALFCSLNILWQPLLCIGSDLTNPRSQGRKFFLLTWKSHNGSWRYLLHEGPNFRDAIKQDGRGKEGSMAELRHELLKHTKDMIFWSSSRRLKFEYPPRQELDEILRFAQSHRIYLQVSPTIEHER